MTEERFRPMPRNNGRSDDGNDHKETIPDHKNQSHNGKTIGGESVDELK
jgi:hypothetical protein